MTRFITSHRQGVYSNIQNIHNTINHHAKQPQSHCNTPCITIDCGSSTTVTTLLLFFLPTTMQRRIIATVTTITTNPTTPPMMPNREWLVSDDATLIIVVFSSFVETDAVELSAIYKKNASKVLQ
jgi:hypothetical protein